MLHSVQFILLFTFLGSGAALNRLGYEYIEDADTWLRLHVVPATWFNARLKCYLEGGQLASPASHELARAMKSLMSTRELVLGRVFTGIHSISKGLGDFTTIEGLPLNAKNLKTSLPWAAGEPDNLNNAEDCVAMSGAGELTDVDCSSTLPYFCHKSNAKMVVNSCGTTDNSYKLDTRTGSCYKFHSLPRAWGHAAAACAAEGAHLAVINSRAESQVLKELFAQHSGDTLKQARYNHIAHIGFWDWAIPKDWLTIFGESLTDAGFAEWAPNEPNNLGNNEHCGSVLRSGQLNDCVCADALAFICEITPP